jgi:hypothetical protein
MFIVFRVVCEAKKASERLEERASNAFDNVIMFAVQLEYTIFGQSNVY